MKSESRLVKRMVKFGLPLGRRSNPGKDFVKSVLRYQETFKRAPIVMWNILRGRYPFHAELKRSGSSVLIYTQKQAALLTLGLDAVHYDFEEDIYEFCLNGVPIKFRGTGAWGDILVDHAYDALSVEGRTVLDVGGYLGDTAVYFCSRGASRVVTLEPYFHALTEENVRLNDWSKLITVVCAALGSRDGKLTVGSASEPEPAKELVEVRDGNQIRVLSLNSCVREFGLVDAVLKLDCEGCEYDSILNADPSVLAQFYAMAIEYHWGADPLVKKLTTAGFFCQVVPSENFMPGSRLRSVGMLYATKSEHKVLGSVE